MLKIIKHVINDLKSDVKFIKDLAQGKANIRKIPKTEWKSIKPIEIFKENYIWFILLILALLVGYNYSAKLHQQKCNEFIRENYILPLREKEGEHFDIAIINTSLNNGLFAIHGGNATHT